MILVDANLLIYAHDSASPRHASARDWLTSVLNGTARVGLPWPSLLAYLRIMTNPRLYARPLTIAQAWADLQSWLRQPCAWIPEPTETHAGVLGGLLEETRVHAHDIMDAHLAALAIEHGLILHSADTGFRRFPRLRFENPLAPA